MTGSVDVPARVDSRSAGRTPPTALLWLARAVAAVGTALAGYLLWASVMSAGQVAGCGTGGSFDCSRVLVSRWSSWLGMPVGLPALVVYASLCGGLFAVGPASSPGAQRLAWRLLLPLATLVTGAASWFSGLQLFALHEFCAYCLLLHSCSLLLAVFVFWYAPLEWLPAGATRGSSVSLTLGRAALLVLAGLVGVGALVGGQLLSSAPEQPTTVTQTYENAEGTPEIAADGNPASKTHAIGSESGSGTDGAGTDAAGTSTAAPPGRHRRIGLAGGKAGVDLYEVPILGAPDSDFVVVEMFDYTCPHCRELHPLMHDVRERLHGRLAVVLLVNPMNKACNKYVKVDHPHHKLACEYARLALAVWLARPTMFAEFHDWLMTGKEIPDLEKSREHARLLAGTKALERALADSGPLDRQLAEHARIYHAIDGGAIPKLLGPNFKMSGVPKSAAELLDKLEAQGAVRR